MTTVSDASANVNVDSSVSVDNLFQVSSFKVIYVYETPTVGGHEGLLNVGDATLHTNKTVEELLAESLSPIHGDNYFITSLEINETAKRRIDEQTLTADIPYNLLFACLAVQTPVLEEAEDGHGLRQVFTPFRDKDVHRMLVRNGIERRTVSQRRGSVNTGEWFVADLQSVKNGIYNVITGNRVGLITSDDDSVDSDIVLREEQEAAVKHGLRRLRGGSTSSPKKVLWSAIMRFGKTFASYELIRRMFPTGSGSRVLVLTHRPAVIDGWRDDFRKMNLDRQGWVFSSRQTRDHDFEDVATGTEGLNQVYFASIQDLRGSGSADSEELRKNQLVFDTEWDLVITDEAHEGTGTDLAEWLYNSLTTPRHLALSGTPFNLVEDYSEDDVFSWDYIDERKAFERFSLEYPMDVNPYADLPVLKMFTYNIEENFRNSSYSSGGSFNFNSFFKTIESDDGVISFVNENDVLDLLDLMSRNDRRIRDRVVDSRFFPFSTVEFRGLFKHTFWLVPSVAAGAALKSLLASHAVFSDYETINVAGDTIEAQSNALNSVVTAIRAVDSGFSNKRGTITLSVGRLTTGVTVPEWTGVFMLSNMNSAQSYMQTIFRVKSSGKFSDGTVKDAGYVFDFAPQRALSMVSRVSGLNADDNRENRERAEEFLHYLPIIAEPGSRFVKYDVNSLMDTTRKVFIERAYSSGFSTPAIFNFGDYAMTNEDVEKFNRFKSIVGVTATVPPSNRITITDSEGLNELADAGTDNDNEATVGNPGEPNTETVTPTDEVNSNAESRRRKVARQILGAVAIRIPLLVAFARLDGNVDRITLDNFPDIVSDETWEIFFPAGFKKTGEEGSWEFAKRFFNRAIFEGAVQEVRNRVANANNISDPLERAVEIISLFNTFKNPDKETVLTPAAVVNKQYVDTVGGFQLLNMDNEWSILNENGEPVYCDNTEISENNYTLNPTWSIPEGNENIWVNPDTTILDINSKSGLYALFAAINLYQAALGQLTEEERTTVDLNQIWAESANRVYVNCRDSYSKEIAQGVLYRSRDHGIVNASVVDIITLINHLNTVRNVEIENVLRLIFNPTDFNKVNKRVDILLKKNGQELKTFIEQLNEKIERENRLTDRFTAVVSNPPYQIDTGGKRHQVYPTFYMVSRVIANHLSMIFPLGWQTSTGRASGSSLHKDIRSDKGIISVDNYYEKPKESPIVLFQSAGTGGVNIIHRSTGYDNNGKVKFFEYGEYIEDRDLVNVKYWSDETDVIFKKLETWIQNAGIDSMFSHVAPRGQHVKSSTWLYKKEEDPLISLTPKPDWVKIYGNFEGNRGARKSWLWVNPEHPNLNFGRGNFTLSKYKIMWSVTGGAYKARRESNTLGIFKPNEIGSGQYIGIYFDVPELAKNYQSYMNTKLHQFCLFEFSPENSFSAYANIFTYVPDLSTITNPRTGKVGWESDWTDADLKTLLADVITEDEWAYIERVALESDGGRE